MLGLVVRRAHDAWPGGSPAAGAGRRPKGSRISRRDRGADAGISSRGIASRRRGSSRALSVVIVGAWMRFPHGMADTSRARLLAQALHEAGARVRVLCLQVSERPPHVENKELRGLWRGVPYEYATWTTVRHESFVLRRLVAAWGWAHGAFRLIQLQRHGHLDVAYLWFWAPRPSVQRYVMLALLHMLRVPVVAELNELPWSFSEGLAIWGRRLSPLRGVTGVVSISAFLTDWALAEAPRGRVRVIEVPIVVDVNEQSPAQYPEGDPIVVFAGSPAYDETIRFIYAAMKRVWMDVPQCRLVVTGTSPSDTSATWLFKESGGLASDVRVTLTGYLARSDLLQLYGRAHALLIPLFDDDRSRARFPTKIGEYLAAARPVVTTAVGETTRYFEDNVNAVVCSPGDSALYGDRIVALLRNPELAASIGRRGRALATARFHYASHSEALYREFASLADTVG